MTSTPKIIVLTPVKNEAWILNYFLTVTSSLADVIVVVDEGSTDGSQQICQRYSKVVHHQRTVNEYDEANRQLFLIEQARNLVSGPKILLALDADEIFAADAASTLDWQRMLHALPGSVLYFEKPDLTSNATQCVRYRNNPSPLGYVDDGARHRGRSIHSTRIPLPESPRKLVLNEIKVMHYAHVRKAAQKAKVRLYSVIENLKKTEPWHRRLRTYDAEREYLAPERFEEIPANWTDGRPRLEVTTDSGHTDYYWHDFEVLRYFNIYGAKRFWIDDIWDIDWEKCRLVARAKQIPGIPTHPISFPSELQHKLRRFSKKLLACYAELKWRRRSAASSHPFFTQGTVPFAAVK